MRRDPPA